MGNKPSPPPAPDYKGAAQEQGAANVEAARIQGKMNNPNVVNPYGTQTTTWGGAPSNSRENFDAQAYLQANPDVARAGMDAWQHYQNYGQGEGRAYAMRADAQGDQPTLTQAFSPSQQALYDQQVKSQQLLGGLGNQGINAAQGVIGNKVDYSGTPAMPGSSEAIRQQVYDAMMQRPNEDIAVQRDNANSQLTAAGIPKDSLAYQNAMRQIDRQQNDARNQAVVSGGVEAQRNYGMDIQSRQQGLNEYNAQRSIPLNEITALMSGSQVSNPFQMPGYAQNAQVAPAPTYAATNATGQYATDIFNQQAAQQGNLQSGLFGLGGSALQGAAMGGVMKYSDRRLKSHIVRIGIHPLGIGIYDYDIDGQRTRGVMADEVLTVRPEAVSRHANGYLQVDYGRLS